jgi:CRP/FNR family transcriptional regulator, cyclic AMP receptor protein
LIAVAAVAYHRQVGGTGQDGTMSPEAGAADGAERIIAFLRDRTFLGALPDGALRDLAKRGRRLKLKKDQTLYERGDAGDSLILILAGRVKIHNVAMDAREVVLNFLGPGDISGEIAVLDGMGRTASATALEPTEGFQLHRRDLLPALAAHPEALMEVVQVLCEKLRNTSEIVEDNQRALRGRAAAGLLRLARTAGRTGKDGILIDLKVSQRDLGAYLGMSRENTNRQMAALADLGILSLAQGLILIRDEAALRRIAESEDA